MATVTGKTSAKIDELLDQRVNGGRIEDGILYLQMADGVTEVNVGSITTELIHYATVNVDTLTEVGFYELDAGTNTPSGAVLPGFVTVCGAGLYSSQIFQVKAGNKFWHRSRNNGTWTSWRELTSNTVAPIDAWPVGSVYIGVSSVNPNTLLGGGTWVAWGTGRVPVGVDTSQTEFDTVEETGGEKTHTLTSAEMPTHHHSILHDHNTASSTDSGAPVSQGRFQRAGGTGSATNTDLVQQPNPTISGDTGSGGAHNNLQPYITCYMWKRTA